MVSFSKPILYVPLSKLSSATETVDLLVQHVFRLQGIPLDRPQFSSQVWKAFCQSLGTTASLTSSKHSQSNGQTERATQDPETFSALCYIPSSSLLEHLPSLDRVCTKVTGKHFNWHVTFYTQGFQPTLFPDQEAEVAAPCVQANFRRCHRVWSAAPQDSSARIRESADRSSAPKY